MPQSAHYSDLISLMRRRAPGQLIIQLTDLCNARCPQCGMRVTERFQRTRLSVSTVKRMLDSAISRGIKIVSFTGGEPLLLIDDLVELINHAGSLGFAYIRTGTNGFLFRNPLEPGFNDRVSRLADRLAATPLRNLWFSIDSSVPALHEQMRGFAGAMEGIAKALPIFHERGLYPSANLGLNRNITEATASLAPGNLEHPEEEERFYQTFRSGLDCFYRMLVDLGFTMTSACYPMSVDPEADTAMQSVYGATATDSVVRFSTREKIALYRALADTVPEFRSRIRIITPLFALHGLIEQHAGIPERSYPCRGGIDYFFVDSKEGQTYPCGYRGNEPMGHFWDLDVRGLNKEAWCRQCDWECFRDPSELFGPVLSLMDNPLALLRRHRQDPRALRLWWQDLRYSRACDFFDGRQPLRTERMRPFAGGQEGGTIVVRPRPMAASAGMEQVRGEGDSARRFGGRQ